jgi:hypothetical protein
VEIAPLLSLRYRARWPAATSKKNERDQDWTLVDRFLAPRYQLVASGRSLAKDPGVESIPEVKKGPAIQEGAETGLH